MCSMKSLPDKSTAVFVCFAITLFLLSGCSTSVFTTQNITYPVLVGPIDRINGKPANALHCTDLAVDAKTSKWFVCGYSCAGDNHQDTPGLFDYRILLAEPEGLTRRVELKDIATGAMSGSALFFSWWDKAWSNVRFRVCDR